MTNCIGKSYILHLYACWYFAEGEVRKTTRSAA